MPQQIVAGIDESLMLVGPADTAPVVLVAVGSRLSHVALHASSSYDTCGHGHNVR